MFLIKHDLYDYFFRYSPPNLHDLQLPFKQILHTQQATYNFLCLEAKKFQQLFCAQLKHFNPPLKYFGSKMQLSRPPYGLVKLKG